MTKQTTASVLEEFSTRREDLIPILQKVQNEDGFISPEMVKQISRRLRISENEIYGVATFYAQFRFIKPGEHTIHVCTGTACHVKGAKRVLDMLELELGIKPGETTEDGKYSLEAVHCLGCCSLAPVVKVDEDVHGGIETSKIPRLLKKYSGDVEDEK
jgi:NADH:ubiquinone oxidoreductase subunit E